MIISTVNIADGALETSSNSATQVLKHLRVGGDVREKVNVHTRRRVYRTLKIMIILEESTVHTGNSLETVNGSFSSRRIHSSGEDPKYAY